MLGLQYFVITLLQFCGINQFKNTHPGLRPPYAFLSLLWSLVGCREIGKTHPGLRPPLPEIGRGTRYCRDLVLFALLFLVMFSK